MAIKSWLAASTQSCRDAQAPWNSYLPFFLYLYVSTACVRTYTGARERVTLIASLFFPESSSIHEVAKIFGLKRRLEIRALKT